MSNKKMGAKDLMFGDTVGAGTAKEFKTGDWRSDRPVWNEKNCIHCMICWAVCPDAAIMVKDGKMTGINYDHCKGCGICNTECPTKADKRALTMEPERR